MQDASNSIAKIKSAFLYKTNFYNNTAFGDEHKNYRFSKRTTQFGKLVFVAFGWLYVVQNISNTQIYHAVINHYDWIVKCILLLLMAVVFVGYSVSWLSDLIKDGFKKGHHLYKYAWLYIAILEATLTIGFYVIEFFGFLKWEPISAKLIWSIWVYLQLGYIVFPIILLNIKNNNFKLKNILWLFSFLSQSIAIWWNLTYNSYIYLSQEKYQKIIHNELKDNNKKHINEIKKRLQELVKEDVIIINSGYLVITLVTFISLFFWISIKNIFDYILNIFESFPNFLWLNSHIYLLMEVLIGVMIIYFLYFFLAVMFRKIHLLLLEQICIYENKYLWN